MDQTYDHRSHRRGTERQHAEGDKHHDPSNHNHTKRDRSRSRSPVVVDNDHDAAAAAEKSKREQFEESRRSRMARLRSENEQEEWQRSAALEEKEQQQQRQKHNEGPKNSIIQVNPDELEGMDEEEQMMALLGFGGGFGSTKGQKVDDNHKSSARGAAAKNKARKYRQYMNRKGGFNRPLDKMD